MSAYVLLVVVVTVIFIAFGLQLAQKMVKKDHFAIINVDKFEWERQRESLRRNLASALLKGTTENSNNPQKIVDAYDSEFAFSLYQF